MVSEIVSLLPYRRPLAVLSAKKLLIFVRSHNPLNDVRNWNSIVVNPYFINYRFHFYFLILYIILSTSRIVRKSRNSYQKVQKSHMVFPLITTLFCPLSLSLTLYISLSSSYTSYKILLTVIRGIFGL